MRCESGLKNLPCKADSDGIDSCGIGQIHQDGSWDDLQRASGIRGSFMDPIAVARVLNWAIEEKNQGRPRELSRWTCAALYGLVP